MWRVALILTLLLAFASTASAQPINVGDACGGDLGGSFPNCTVNFTHLLSPITTDQGGTGQRDPQSARGPNGLDIDAMPNPAPGDANYTVTQTDRSVSTTAAFTAARTWTLPQCNRLNPGHTIDIADHLGTLTATNTLTITADTTTPDLINGAASVALNSAYSSAKLVCDGISKWALLGTLQPFTASAGQAITAVSKLGVYTTTGFGTGTGTVNSGTGPAIAQYPAGTGTTVGASTVSGDATIAQGGALTVTKTNGVAFATSATTDTTNASNISSGNLANARLTAALAATTSFAVASDNAVTTLPRTGFFFSDGRVASIVGNENLGTYKTANAITIENIELDVGVSPTCSVTATITIYDCGTSAGACTSGQTATIATINIASGTAQGSSDATISTANVAAAHYISAHYTAGTCTASENTVTMMARPQ